MHSTIIVILILFQIGALNATVKWRSRTQFAFKKPAFINALKNTTSLQHDLIISSFGVSIFGGPIDGVFINKNIGDSLKRSQFDIKKVGGNLLWPNEVEFIGNTTFVAGGFLVPGKKGHISYMDTNVFASGYSAEWNHLIENDKGFFHRVRSVRLLPPSVNDDGSRLVSCRGRKGVFDKGSGEMVYFNGRTGLQSANVLFNGCDCFFETVDFNNDGIVEFVVPEFFGSKLLLVWTEEPSGDYTKKEFIRQRIIDSEIGMAFDVQIADLNGDGIPDILATNHQGSKSKIKPSVIEYIVSFRSEAMTQQKVFTPNSVTDFMESIQFEKKVIANKFNVRKGTINAAAPGGAKLVSIGVNSPLKAIVVSGDDSGKAYIMLKKKSNYEILDLHDCSGTVGGIYVGDIDGDGWNEIFVPCYAKNYIAVYSFYEEE